MVSGKREIQDTKIDQKIRKKTRLRKLVFWLMVDLTVAVVVFAMLLYKPGSYDPSELASASLEPGQVSTYLTHELSPGLYNGAQRGEPFDLVVTQEGINEIVAGLGWPKISQGIMLYDPAVLFVPDAVMLMGTADVKGMKFVVTIVLEPKIGDDGLLELQVSKVKIGAMNITPLAKMTAQKMYAQRFGAGVDADVLPAKILGALLNGERFEPVFKIDGRKVRVEKIAVCSEELTVRFIPSQ
ncbi:MAG: hypothetical protein ABIF19_09835 [Planctomycetota bacterium]